MRWQTRFTREYGVALPIVSAGMAIITGAELAAAVSRAGALAIVGTGPAPIDTLEALVGEVRRTQPGPLGINLIIENTSFGPCTTLDHVAFCIEQRLTPVVFFWNLPPSKWISDLKAAGLKVWATASSADEALAAVNADIDAVIAQGAGAGGHVRSRLDLMTLVPAVRDAIGGTLLIAAGGIGDGRGMAAALALGADAVCIGTRLVATNECLAHGAYKQRIVDARAEQTEITRLFGPEWPDAPMRVIHNRALDATPTGADRPETIGETVVFGQRYMMPRDSAVVPTNETRGDLDAMCLAAGTSVEFIHSIEPAADVLQAMADDAARYLLAALPGS